MELVSTRGAGEGSTSADIGVLYTGLMRVSLIIPVYKLSALSYLKPDLTCKMQLMKGEIEHFKCLRQGYLLQESMLALVFRKKGKKIKRGVKELYAYSLTYINPLLNVNTGTCLNYAKKADY
jgi:hypothetical protein